jgi:hypothetical protein
VEVLGLAPVQFQVVAVLEDVDLCDAADALRYLVATKSRTIAQRKSRGL